MVLVRSRTDISGVPVGTGGVSVGCWWHWWGTGMVLVGSRTDIGGVPVGIGRDVGVVPVGYRWGVGGISRELVWYWWGPKEVSVYHSWVSVRCWWGTGDLLVTYPWNTGEMVRW